MVPGKDEWEELNEQILTEAQQNGTGCLVIKDGACTHLLCHEPK